MILSGASEAPVCVRVRVLHVYVRARVFVVYARVSPRVYTRVWYNGLHALGILFRISHRRKRKNSSERSVGYIPGVKNVPLNAFRKLFPSFQLREQ